MQYEKLNNVSKTYVNRKTVPAESSGYMDNRLVAHGFVDSVKIRFAAGESGTLHIRPVVIIPGEIMIDLLEYSPDGDPYVSGDDEQFVSSVQCEIENDAVLRVFYDNTGPGESFINVDIGVTYFQIVEPRNIIG